VIAAVFTCRLGVAGTLIGMELTAVVITLSSAIFKAQLMKASHHLASLPKMVRGRPPYSRFKSLAKRTRNPEPSTPDKALACSPACAPCQASSESYRPSRGPGYASLVCSPGWQLR
jgi:hypothetical protein